MKRHLINLGLILSLIVIAYLVLKPAPKDPVSEQEMANISKAISNQFAQAPARQQEKKSSPQVENSSQSIIAVIYKKPDTTWFFKAKDTTDRINGISASFKNYFVDQLKFDQDHQPIFSHIPESMHAANTSSMRVATYQIAGVEVSVSRLGGNQDVYANVKRWMKQIGLDDNAEIQLDYKDNKNTILVKMPK